ncbi:hypothetical protein NX059_012189 [Plenodomus lindquistii]|nr:hypothetical protein NX059_012189 [Plenodomus lindquistii]
MPDTRLEPSHTPFAAPASSIKASSPPFLSTLQRESVNQSKSSKATPHKDTDHHAGDVPMGDARSMNDTLEKAASGDTVMSRMRMWTSGVFLSPSAGSTTVTHDDNPQRTLKLLSTHTKTHQPAAPINTKEIRKGSSTYVYLEAISKNTTDAKGRQLRFAISSMEVTVRFNVIHQNADVPEEMVENLVTGRWCGLREGEDQRRDGFVKTHSG